MHCSCLLEWLTLNSAILLILLTLLITLFIHFGTKYLERNTQETEQMNRNSIKQLKNFNWMQDRQMKDYRKEIPKTTHHKRVI